MNVFDSAHLSSQSSPFWYCRERWLGWLAGLGGSTFVGRRVMKEGVDGGGDGRKKNKTRRSRSESSDQKEEDGAWLRRECISVPTYIRCVAARGRRCLLEARMVQSKVLLRISSLYSSCCGRRQDVMTVRCIGSSKMPTCRTVISNLCIIHGGHAGLLAGG
ncbi:hypothetical protein N658DRAFT_84657 [Parathielavia hyrcaniae]|uniref:Uncharacterized protein n=1 Tax=Parathielavia hyrcaniae TaxID=113614 RepID=A0AAN6Q138_9PEZI|nr:hypothetical protein N658DRAFT_84657 [Parathielavia hyrcaniae]